MIKVLLLTRLWIESCILYFRFLVILCGYLLIYCFIFDDIDKSYRGISAVLSVGFCCQQRRYNSGLNCCGHNHFYVYSDRFLHLHSNKWTEYDEDESRLTSFTVVLQLISYCIKRWSNALFWTRCWCLVGYIEAFLPDGKPSANFASRFYSWIMVIRDCAIFVSSITHVVITDL